MPDVGSLLRRDTLSGTAGSMMHRSVLAIAIAKFGRLWVKGGGPALARNVRSSLP
jgi:hypothetical protein